MDNEWRFRITTAPEQSGSSPGYYVVDDQKYLRKERLKRTKYNVSECIWAKEKEKTECEDQSERPSAGG